MDVLQDGGKKITPVILSGGEGKRLWPLSSMNLPKPFLPLTGNESLFEASLRRIKNDNLFGNPIIVCASPHRFIVRDMCRALDVRAQLIMEPVARGTAPALMAAALAALDRDPDAVVLGLPADHHIPDIKAFQAGIRRTLPALEKGRMVLFGVKPDSAHTGYGYIKRGVPLDDLKGIYNISDFKEKPDERAARRYLNEGGYDWNAGIFLMKARDYQSELARYEPEIVRFAEKAWRHAEKDSGDFLLEEESYARAPQKSIDCALMEHTDKGCVMPVDYEWADLGCWDALWAAATKNDAQTASRGNVVTHDVTGSYLHSEGPLLCAVDVQDIIAVATGDAVLITRRGQSEKATQILINKRTKACHE